jgi:hypothetical protein
MILLRSQNKLMAGLLLPSLGPEDNVSSRMRSAVLSKTSHRLYYPPPLYYDANQKHSKTT